MYDLTTFSPAQLQTLSLLVIGAYGLLLCARAFCNRALRAESTAGRSALAETIATINENAAPADTRG